MILHCSRYRAHLCSYLLTQHKNRMWYSTQKDGLTVDFSWMPWWHPFCPLNSYTITQYPPIFQENFSRLARERCQFCIVYKYFPLNSWIWGGMSSSPVKQPLRPHTVTKLIDFPRYNMKCRGGKRDTTRNISCSTVFRFPLHFMLYRGNLDYFFGQCTCHIKRRRRGQQHC